MAMAARQLWLAAGLLALASCRGGGGVHALPPVPAGAHRALAAAAVPPAVVQSGAIAGGFQTTLALPPLAGDLLVAIGFNGKSSIKCATGWTSIRTVLGNYIDGVSCYRIVSGDTATVTPLAGTTAADNGGEVWEIAGQAASGFIDSQAGGEGGQHTFTLTLNPTQASDLIVGGGAINTALTGVVPTGYVKDFGAAPLATTGFSMLLAHNPNAAAGTQTVTWAFNSTTDTHPVTALAVAIVANGLATPTPTPSPTPVPTPTPTPTPPPPPTPTPGPPGTLATVQSGPIAGTASATFAQAPANGDLLVAIGFNGRNSIGCAAGWTSIRRLVANYVDGQSCYRIANGEGTAQTPFSGTATNIAGFVWEIAGQSASGFIDAQAGAEGGQRSLSLTFSTTQTGDIVLGGGAINAALSGLTPSGYARDFLGAPVASTGFSALFAHNGSAPAGTQTVTWAFNSTTDTHPVTAFIVAVKGNAATPTPPPPPTPAPIDWRTFGNDLPRTGYNPNETTLGVSTIARVQQVWPQSAHVGFGMVGEPVVAANVSVNGQARNVLYAGSNFGTTFKAIDADTGATIWSAAVGTASYMCGTSSSTFGVAGTPVLDRARSRVYAADGQNMLHAFDLATGAEAAGWPIAIANIAPDHNFIYAGLTFNPNNGMLYVETSSTCDISPWFGRIDAVNTASAAIVGTFFPTQGSSGGGIWGYGGASIDPATNNVFVAIGNADGSNETLGYGEQIVELSPDVSTVIANNLPPLQASPDADFGATPLLFQPPGCPPLLAAVNKSGAFVLYDRTNINAGPLQVIQMSISTDAGDFIGVPAYDPQTNEVYVGLPATTGIYQAGLGAFGMQSNCTLNPTPVWNAPFGPDGATTTSDTPRSAVTIANGVAYVSNFSGKTVFAFDAAGGGRLWSAPLSDFGIPGPVVVNGRVYVGAYDGTITAWGL